MRSLLTPFVQTAAALIVVLAHPGAAVGATPLEPAQAVPGVSSTDAAGRPVGTPTDILVADWWSVPNTPAARLASGQSIPGGIPGELAPLGPPQPLGPAEFATLQFWESIHEALFEEPSTIASWLYTLEDFPARPSLLLGSNGDGTPFVFETVEAIEGAIEDQEMVSPRALNLAQGLGLSVACVSGWMSTHQGAVAVEALAIKIAPETAASSVWLLPTGPWSADLVVAIAEDMDQLAPPSDEGGIAAAFDCSKHVRSKVCGPDCDGQPDRKYLETTLPAYQQACEALDVQLKAIDEAWNKATQDALDTYLKQIGDGKWNEEKKKWNKGTNQEDYEKNIEKCSWDSLGLDTSSTADALKAGAAGLPALSKEVVPKIASKLGSLLTYALSVVWDSTSCKWDEGNKFKDANKKSKEAYEAALKNADDIKKKDTTLQIDLFNIAIKSACAPCAVGQKKD